MAARFQQLKFKFTWRSYQQRFLDHFQEHILDNHLHVVAPPGSGKTILGLEMLRQVGKPTLVLAPTLTIRNQWQSRLETFFLNNGSFDGYTLDIKNPKTLTFSTYQSLHALGKSLPGKEDALKLFIEKQGIQAVVLDEAHHLKNEWWKNLMALKEIENLTVISLTATPPYDSSAQELAKYFQLCGPIDEEIAVPDLIQNEDLCPHQDFVFFSKPDKAQIKYIITYREQILAFMNSLLRNNEFQQLLLQHPLYADTDNSLEALYEKPHFFSAILIFLKAAGCAIDSRKLRVLGFEGKSVDFPNLNYEWLERLLQELLVVQRTELFAYEPLLSSLEKQLAKIGVFEKKRVNFVGDEQLYRSLANSPSKLQSIHTILEAEAKQLGPDLKAVVLTDFIRKEFLDFKGDDRTLLNKLGVVSIFQTLRVQGSFEGDLAVLTGSLIILHIGVLPAFKEQLRGAHFQGVPLPSDGNFLVVEARGSVKNHLVAAVTALFQAGDIKILIGTKSLLGEGWDAPAMNTLILASYVGSFVSSNQMRGRAIRRDTNAAHKTGNIWHLACLDPTREDGGKDLEKLQRRFEAFSGVSAAGTTYIENGLERLQLPTKFSPDMDLQDLNARMMQLANDRASLKTRWFDAISKGSVLIREVKVPYLDDLPPEETKKLRWGNASKFLLLEVLTGVTLFFPEFLAKHLDVLLGKGVFQFLYVLLAAVFVGFAPKTFKAVQLYFMFGNTYKKTKKIAKALLEALLDTGKIQTSNEAVSLVAEQHVDGSFVCYLKGATNAESSLFVNLLAEIIAPIENPRYLLVYRHWLRRLWGRHAYYVVPSLFGKRKQDAQHFHRFWRTHVDRSKLLYVRSVKGRKALLKARFSHIVYQFKEVSKKAITWK